MTQLNKGEQAKVIGFHAGDRGYRRKLMAMGLVPGTPFQLTAKAPLGDPITLKVRGYQLTLRQKEANQLKLERIDP